MSFEFDISPKDAASAEFMTRVHRVLRREMMKAAKEKKLSRADVARLLDVDKAVVSRALNGTSNLTIRTISDLCWAMGIRPSFEACEEASPKGCNGAPPDTTEVIMVSPKRPKGSVPEVIWSSSASKSRTKVTTDSQKSLTKFDYAG